MNNYKGLNKKQQQIIKNLVVENDSIWCIDCIEEWYRIEELRPHELFFVTANRFIGDLRADMKRN